MCSAFQSADGDSDKFHIQYILFGSPSEDRLLVPTTGGQFSILEKINIHFRASLATIRDYFQKVFYIPIEVYCNNSVIGRIRFSVLIPPPLDPTARRAKIYEVYDRCYFAPSATATALFAPIDGEDAPWIEYEFVLELLHPLSPQLSPQLQLSPQPDVQQQPPPVEAVALELPAASSSSIDFGGAGDQPKTRTPHSQRVSLVRTENNNNNVSTTAIMPVEQAGSPAPAPWSVALTPNTAKVTPKTFSYQLTLQQVRFTRKVEPGIWQVSLHHPKAHTPIALLNISVRETSTASTFENVTVELLFSFAASGIRSVIESEPCVLNIKGPHAIFATAELDNGTLLGQQRTAGIVLMENEAGEKIAMAHAYVELTDLGANLNAQQPKFTRFAQPNGGGGGGGAAGSSCGGGGGGGGARLKPHLDEELAYKMVEELEQWKTQQQDSFLVELKRREINHLARLTTEWTRRRSELEALLTQKFEQCSQLTSALEVANKNVRVNVRELRRVDSCRGCINACFFTGQTTRRHGQTAAVGAGPLRPGEIVQEEAVATAGAGPSLRGRRRVRSEAGGAAAQRAAVALRSAGAGASTVQGAAGRNGCRIGAQQQHGAHRAADDDDDDHWNGASQSVAGGDGKKRVDACRACG